MVLFLMTFVYRIKKRPHIPSFKFERHGGACVEQVVRVMEKVVAIPALYQPVAVPVINKL
jgi:hypothetical protein